jgi:putative sterol carrier protein
VPRYLSSEWFDDLNSAARRSSQVTEAAAGTTLTLQQVVTGGPDGEVLYWVRVSNGTVQAGPGEAAHADATIVQSWETAVAIASGEMDVESALMAGKVRVSGNMAPLMESRSSLEGLNAALAEVRGRTTYG